MIARGRSRFGTAVRSIQTSSVEPPPMSTTRSCSVRVETSGAQEMTASRASSSGWMISSARPVSRSTCARNCAPLRRPPAGLGGDEAHAPDVVLGELLRQTRMRLMVRAIAARDSRPDASSPWPSWTDFEKQSTTWNWLPLGWAISMRQLFVPRSSAA